MAKLTKQKVSRKSTGVVATDFQEYNRWCDEMSGAAVVSVRQIPLNRRSVTGLVPSRKNQTMVAFESTLERDFVTLLEFDLRVVAYQEQPVRIRYVAPGGRTVTGFPDFLATRRECDGEESFALYDIKYRREIFERWRELKPRLKAARQYATSQGWLYRIMTEVEIRTPYLHNAKFLLPYQRCAPSCQDADKLIHALARMRQSTPAELIAACERDRYDQARLIPTLWNLVAARFVGTDLNLPLTMASPLWGL